MEKRQIAYSSLAALTAILVSIIYLLVNSIIKGVLPYWALLATVLIAIVPLLFLMAEMTNFIIHSKLKRKEVKTSDVKDISRDKRPKRKRA